MESNKTYATETQSSICRKSHLINKKLEKLCSGGYVGEKKVYLVYFLRLCFSSGFQSLSYLCLDYAAISFFGSLFFIWLSFDSVNIAARSISCELAWAWNLPLSFIGCRNACLGWFHVTEQKKKKDQGSHVPTYNERTERLRMPFFILGYNIKAERKTFWTWLCVC